MQNPWVSLLIGVCSGLAATLLASAFAFHREFWQAKRHTYVQLLRELERGDRGQIVERMNLVALMAPRKISSRVLRCRDRIISLDEDTLNQDLCAETRDELFDLFYNDIQPKFLLRDIL